MVIVDVALEVLVQVIDTRREDRYLHFGGAGIPFMGAMFRDNFRLCYWGQILSLLLSLHFSFYYNWQLYQKERLPLAFFG
jgi:hypothetical protein